MQDDFSGKVLLYFQFYLYLCNCIAVYAGLSRVLIEGNIYGKEAIRLIGEGKSLFITGKAGTGKTTLLKEIVNRLRSEGRLVAVTAPTGVAAHNAQGVTLHSLLRLPLAPYLPGVRIPRLYDLKEDEIRVIRNLEVGIEHGNGFNLVGKEKRPTVPGRIWQHECDGWYIYSNISNGTKKDDLLRISDYHHLGLKVEEGKPE